MGFSLKMFIQELESLLQEYHNDENILASEVLQNIKFAVESNKKYAKECGQLK